MISGTVVACFELLSCFDRSKAFGLHINAAISISEPVGMTNDPEAGARIFGSTCEDNDTRSIRNCLLMSTKLEMGMDKGFFVLGLHRDME